MADAAGDAWMDTDDDETCRINALPVDILRRAISFMDARLAVRTCVLSRKWRGLWRSAPRVNVSRHEFHGMADTEKECVELFKKFVPPLLLLRDHTAALEEFRMNYCIPEGAFEDGHIDANVWIRHVLLRKVRSLHVVNKSNELHPDSMVFASEFLTSLLLLGVYLKPGFFRDLQTGCTVLQRLTLQGCTIADPQISSQTLKVLIICDENSCTYEGQASISIPSLIRLGFSPPEGLIPLLENMESLVTASVEVGYDSTGVDGISTFLGSLSGVRNLKFYFYGAKLAVESNLQWCPNFNNLTTLSLDEWCLSADFYPLIVFLKNSPNLAQLILKLRKGCTCGGLSDHLEESLFTCKDLQIVKIFCFADWEDDPVVNRLKKLLLDNGITSDKIEMIEILDQPANSLEKLLLDNVITYEKIEILDQSSSDSDFSSSDSSSNQ